MKLVWVKSGKERYAELLKLGRAVEKTEIEAVKAVGKSFIDGLDNVIVMLQLPRLVLMHSIVQNEAVMTGLQVVSEHMEDMSNIDMNDLLQQLREKLENIPTTKEVVLARYKQLASQPGVFWANLELERIMKLHSKHGKSFQTLIYSAVVWVWTLFEVAASDLWETALNAHFDTLGKSALQRMAGNDKLPLHEDKMRGKYIRVSDLARFGYNIRDNVGSVLRCYFDFTSLAGIKEAYKFVFPRSIALRNSLDCDSLRWLSEDRNIIVHNAGFIDLRYKNLTNTTQKIGEQVNIGENMCDDYLAVVAKAFGSMLHCVNSYSKLGKLDDNKTDLPQ